jgi:hypothetical protein
MSEKLEQIRNARAFRDAQPAETVRVGFPDGFAYFQTLGHALGGNHSGIYGGRPAGRSASM